MAIIDEDTGLSGLISSSPPSYPWYDPYGIATNVAKGAMFQDYTPGESKLSDILMTPGIDLQASVLRMLPGFAKLWAQGPQKQLFNALTSGYRALEAASPAMKKVLQDTVLEFRGPHQLHGKVPAMTNVKQNVIKHYPMPKAFAMLKAATKDKNVPSEFIDNLAKMVVDHETSAHIMLKDPKLYKKAEALYDRLDPATKTYFIQKTIKDPSLETLDSLSSAEATNRLRRKLVEEFVGYSREANMLGDKAISVRGRDFASFSKNNPELKQILKEANDLRLESADEIMKSLDAYRKSNATTFSEQDFYLLKDIEDSLKRDMSPVISSKTRGVVHARKPSPKYVELRPKTEKEAVKENIGQRKRIKEYIPKEEGGPKPVSIKPMYANQERLQNEDSIDKITKDIKNPQLKESVSAILRNMFEKTQP